MITKTMNTPNGLVDFGEGSPNIGFYQGFKYRPISKIILGFEVSQTISRVQNPLKS